MTRQGGKVGQVALGFSAHTGWAALIDVRRPTARSPTMLDTDAARLVKSRAMIKRCSWADGDPLLAAYHDQEWGVPERDGRALWEKLVLDGFQAGLAWITVLRKRDALRKAFRGFVPAKVARFGEADVARLLGDAGIIRSRAKIEATIKGARIYCEMAERGEDFGELAWSFTRGRVVKGNGRSVASATPLSEKAAKELKRRGFLFVGPTIVHAWMQAVGIVNDHAIDCYRRDQV